MSLLRPLVLNSFLRANCYKFGKNLPTDKNVDQIQALLWNKQPQRNFILGRRRFCRWREESVQEEDLSDDALEDKKETPTVTVSTSEIFNEISSGDPVMLKKLKLLEFEMVVLRNSGNRVPEVLTKVQWKELLAKNSINQRKKYLEFLRTNELKSISSRQKSKIRSLEILKRKEEEGFHYYGLGGQSMFLRIYEKSLKSLLSLRQFSHHSLQIIFDCSYNEFMSEKNKRACLKQIKMSAVESRLHRYPSKIEFCNFALDEPMREKLEWFKSDGTNSYGFDFYKESYLDVHPREKLVYLSPHAQNDLVFNRDNIYIIGAFVDKGTGLKMSVGKAKQANIKCARFPIDKFADWKQGTKSLPINLTLRILLDMAFYNDWNTAFKNLPTRCLKNFGSDFYISKDYFDTED